MGVLTRRPSNTNRAITGAIAFLLLFALVPVLPAQAGTATWYVDVASGSDANPGTADSPFKTITAGLAAASEGDVVRVAPGTYRAAAMNEIGVALAPEGELFPLMVPSGVTLNSSGGPDVTIIDGENEGGDLVMPVATAEIGDSGPLLVIEEATGVTVQGFTLTRGSSFAGGGAAVAGSDEVVFDNVVFDDNRAFAGGGMFVIDASVELVGCLFLGSFAGFDFDDEDLELRENGYGEPEANAYAGGGLAAVGSEIVLRECDFVGNVAYLLGAGALFDGCTVEVDGAWLESGYVTAEQVTVEGGTIESFDGPEVQAKSPWTDRGEATIQDDYYDDYVGGGFAFLASEAAVHDTWFVGNSAPNGGGVFADDLSDVTVSDSAFEENFAISGAGVMSGRFNPAWAVASEFEAAGIELGEESFPMPDPGLSIDKSVFGYNSADSTVEVRRDYGAFPTEVPGDHGGPATIANSLFHENFSWIGVVRAEATDIWNCTFADNGVGGMISGLEASDLSPATIFYEWSTVVVDPDSSVVNSVLWGNGSEEFDFDLDADLKIQGLAGPADIMGGYVAYTNAEHPIEAHEAGSGNISKNPLFVEPMWADYRLRPGSPSIDTGTNTGAPREDLLGRARPYDGNLSGTAVTDMGAYEYRPEKAVRLGGADRYSTSVRISQENFEHSDTVLIARGDDFSDGLAASGLAGLYGAPLLLTKSDTLPPQVAAEIERLGASEVIIVGGRQAVSDGVKADLQALGLMVERVAGEDRYRTAERIAERIADAVGDPEVLFLVRGDEFPDALAVSPVAYARHAPILLVKPSEWAAPGIGVSTSVNTTVYIAGGEAAVSETVEESVKNAGMNVERIAGRDRYDTAAQFGKRAVREGWATFEFVGLATGQDFPDALTGGSAIGSHNGVLMLTPATALHWSVERVLRDNKALIRKVEVFGGPTALSQPVMQFVESAVGPRN